MRDEAWRDEKTRTDETEVRNEPHREREQERERERKNGQTPRNWLRTVVEGELARLGNSSIQVPIHLTAVDSVLQDRMRKGTDKKRNEEPKEEDKKEEITKTKTIDDCDSKSQQALRT